MTNSSPTGGSPPFELVAITPAPAPAGASGADWHSYLIAQGENTIAGLRRGSLAAVTEAVEDIVARLNARRGGKAATTYPTSISRTRPIRT